MLLLPGAGGVANDDTGAAAAQLGLAAQAGMLGVLEALLASGAALLSPADRAHVGARAGLQGECRCCPPAAACWMDGSSRLEPAECVRWPAMSAVAGEVPRHLQRGRLLLSVWMRRRGPDSPFPLYAAGGRYGHPHGHHNCRCCPAAVSGPRRRRRTAGAAATGSVPRTAGAPGTSCSAALLCSCRALETHEALAGQPSQDRLAGPMCS